MTTPLARLRVRETHGIRRFLYPLSAQITLPEGTDANTLSLSTIEGQVVPTQATQYGPGRYRLDFALSLAPYQEQEIVLSLQSPQAKIEDPLAVTLSTDGVALRSRQAKFSLGLDAQGNLMDVVYDGVSHLRAPSAITRSGREMQTVSHAPRVGETLLAAWNTTQGHYDSNAGAPDAETRTELTACKSWATVTHTLRVPRLGDRVVFTLPLSALSPTLTCDFGVGGGIYGKLQARGADSVEWRTTFDEGGPVQWILATNDRVDYQEKCESAEAYQPQRWFHVLDSGKALAIAVTRVPAECREIAVRLTVAGDVSIAFTLGQTVAEAVEFGVCYHFLNDVPALAAATNPQSILLPPLVEVLPA